MQGLTVQMVERPPHESLGFEPSDTTGSEFSPTIGVVLDFMILYRVEDDSRRLADAATNRVFRTDEYGVLHISSQHRGALERELVVRRHLTREFKLHGFDVNLIDNNGEFARAVVENNHPHASHCEDPLHCRWSIARTYSACLDAQQLSALAGDARFRDTGWLALRLVSPALAARKPESVAQLGRAVRLLNGYRTFVNGSCEFNLHYGNGLAGFGTRALRALAQAVWLLDPLMDTYHPAQRRDGLYPPYTQAKVRGHGRPWREATSSAASRSNLANHMTAADVVALLGAGTVRWGQEMWDEARLEDNRPPPGLATALGELGRCGSTFSVATLMAPMPRPAYDFGDYLWRDADGAYVCGGPHLVLRQHRPTLEARLVAAWAAFWAAFFDRALAVVDAGAGDGPGGAVVNALGPLAAYHEELRASDGNPLALRRAQGRLRQFLAWMRLRPLADLWELPPPPARPL